MRGWLARDTQSEEHLHYGMLMTLTSNLPLPLLLSKLLIYDAAPSPPATHSLFHSLPLTF